ncbi:MAG: ATP-dependent protease ATPase subunit HslU [Sphaerochaetaceae bacterium]|nr:ATP-dependent protease ATPase subunit HslU [Sphaerochaetaceae bacterium]
MNLDQMTPRQIVGELDKYIIGQHDAKRAVAIALRSRYRRKLLPETMRDEVAPKNIILIGPTGVGKTEIARRISRLANTPFVKVEATKYTEVGYVGRDVESMVRDLMAVGVQMTKQDLAEQQKDAVARSVNERLLDLLLPSSNSKEDSTELAMGAQETREKFRKYLEEGRFEDRVVEMSVKNRPAGGSIELLAGGNVEDLQNTLQSLGSMFNGNGKKRKVSIKRAREILTEEEMDRMVDHEQMVELAKERVEQMGIIFIDEIDKIAGSRGAKSGPDVSREGVQRDILPIVEGSKVNTKWGMIDTSHILFIGAGAFHVSKPSDLIPELQGRFPLRVELNELTADDFHRILIEPENAIIKQYIALMNTEEVTLEFDDDALQRISEVAYSVNSSTENIGARRLYTIMEKLLDDISFRATDLTGTTFRVTRQYVDERLMDVLGNEDLSRYIL